MASSARRLERTARRIYKDISSLTSSNDLLLSRLSSQQGRITKLHEELRRVTDSIALRMEMSSNMEYALANPPSEAETNLLSPSRMRVWEDPILSPPGSPKTQVSITSPDMFCYETTLDVLEPLIDLTSPQNGYGEPLELENQELLMNDFLERLLRSPEPSGGRDTNWNLQ